MFEGSEVVSALRQLGITDVAWLPDSALGPWESALDRAGDLKLRRVCREGEAWALAAGLYLGGRNPLVMIQSTGFFESGDSLRNALFDFGLPLYAIIGYRSYLVENSPDTARRYLEPILDAWGIDHVLMREPRDLAKFVEHCQSCRAAGRPGAALLAEGKM